MSGLLASIHWHSHPTFTLAIFHTCFKNAYRFITLGALKFSLLNKLHIFQCMSENFCVQYQRVPLKSYTRYFTGRLENAFFMQCWKFKRWYTLLKHPSSWKVKVFYHTSQLNTSNQHQPPYIEILEAVKFIFRTYDSEKSILTAWYIYMKKPLRRCQNMIFPVIYGWLLGKSAYQNIQKKIHSKDFHLQWNKAILCDQFLYLNDVRSGPISRMIFHHNSNSMEIGFSETP